MSCEKLDELNKNYFGEFVSIVERLRAPGGCPWDREQKLEDLRTYITEEAYELTDAITSGDMDKVREEAGDLLLQIVFLSVIASETGAFGIRDVTRGIGEKLIRRHPHVFGGAAAGDSEQVLRNWERIKQEERKDKKENLSILAGVPKGLPPLLKAHRMQSKAAHVGFDWPRGNLQPLFDKLDEETAELKEAATLKQNAEDIEDELGDLLFMTVNLARHLDVNPDAALSGACSKFAGRFQKVEEYAASGGRSVNDYTPEELDAFWVKAKREE